MIINITETWCFTGHRPDKLHGYDKQILGNIKLRWKINEQIIYVYNNFGINTFISGMALGTDLWAAECILELKDYFPLKLICAVPCKNHSDTFYGEDKELYKYILDNADYVHQVTGIKYFPRCLQIRNEWMVNNSSGQIAVWNGSKGGTANCINYADSVGKTSRVIIHPKTFHIDVNA